VDSPHIKLNSRRGFLKYLGAAGPTLAVPGEAPASAAHLSSAEMPSVPSGTVPLKGVSLAAESFPAVTSKVASHQGQPAIDINGKARTPIIYALTTSAEGAFFTRSGQDSGMLGVQFAWVCIARTNVRSRPAERFDRTRHATEPLH